MSIRHYQNTWKVQCKLFVNAILSKDQLYKHKSQINKVPPSASKTTYSSFPIICASHIINFCNLLSCYHIGRILICRYPEIMPRNNVKLFLEFLVNFLAIIRTRLWLLAYLKGWGAFQYCYFGIQNPCTFKLSIKIPSADTF